VFDAGEEEYLATNSDGFTFVAAIGRVMEQL